MRIRARLLLVCFLCATLTSCSLRFPLDVLLIDGKVVFWTEREWKWFVVPHRPKAELCSIDVYDRDEYLWRLKAVGKCVEDAIPITYGAKPAGFVAQVEARPLRPNVRYGVTVGSWEHGEANFLLPNDLTKDILLLGINDVGSVYDPDQRRIMEAREKRLAELVSQGLSEEEAFEAYWKEREASQASNKAATAPPSAANTPVAR